MGLDVPRRSSNKNRFMELRAVRYVESAACGLDSHSSANDLLNISNLFQDYQCKGLFT